MATLIPPEIRQDAPHSEKLVFAKAKELSSSWTVIHDLRWQDERNGRQGDGQCDFLFIHPEVGLVDIEVKGGDIRVMGGRWQQWSPRDGTWKTMKLDPYAQAETNKHGLRSFCLKNAGHLSKVPFMHGACLPSVDITGDLAPHARESITIDRRGLTNLEVRLREIARHWGFEKRFKNRDISDLVRVLAPTFELRVKLAHTVQTASEKLVRFTSVQRQALEAAKRNSQLLILGGAGSGKTVVGTALAKWLADTGKSVRFFCYNGNLANKLASDLRSHNTIDVMTFHSFAVKCSKALGNRNPKPESWFESDAALDILAALEAKLVEPVDAVIIDEAQDFALDWITALSESLSDNSAGIIALADDKQNLYKRWESLRGWPVSVLMGNARNTDEIAQLVNGIWGEPTEVRGVSGPTPVSLKSHSEKSLAHDAASLVDSLISDDGVPLESIAVLTDSHAVAKRIRKIALAQTGFCKFGETGVVCETIRRFKGLEADVIVLVLSEALQADLDLGKRMTYVGTSRARAALFTVGTDATLSAVPLIFP